MSFNLFFNSESVNLFNSEFVNTKSLLFLIILTSFAIEIDVYFESHLIIIIFTPAL